MRLKKNLLFLFLLFAAVNYCIAQDTINKMIVVDTIDAKFFLDAMFSPDPHSVLKAALFSAVIPGLGQAYNGKYWKIPIVYAALGISSFFIYDNASYYSDLKNTYLLRIDNDSTTFDEFVGRKDDYVGNIPNTELLIFIDEWRKYTDLAVLVTSAIYLLNIIDAVVDAHLYDFDISDDLSMHIQPYYVPKNVYSYNHHLAFGLNLNFTFK